jgi:hypothetical protein
MTVVTGHHAMSYLRELWQIESFRARIFFAIAPTIVAVAFGYLATDHMHPYDFIGEESSIIPPSGRGGDQVTVVWKVHHNRSCPGTVERQLVDPDTGAIIALYDLSPAALNGLPSGDGYLRKTFALPKNVQTGWIAYQAKLAYTCNWLQVIAPVFAVRYTTPKLLFKVEP